MNEVSQSHSPSPVQRRVHTASVLAREYDYSLYRRVLLLYWAPRTLTAVLETCTYQVWRMLSLLVLL